ncbi:MAG: HAD family hydrolase [Thermodesulfobacteriota bacterium]
MIELSVPGFGELRLRHLVCDYNGTLALDGRLLDGVVPLLDRISGRLDIHIITADTFGTVARALAGTLCIIHVLAGAETDEAMAKANYARSLGAGEGVCIGNGRNDRLMLAEAGLAIAVIQREGAATAALRAAHLAVIDVRDGLELLLCPRRLLATLRG